MSPRMSTHAFTFFLDFFYSQTKAKWIEVYLWGKLIFLVYEIIVLVIAFFSDPFAAIWLILTWCLEVYFWLCVNSYYLELQGSVTVVTRTTTVLTA